MYDDKELLPIHSLCNKAILGNETNEYLRYILGELIPETMEIEILASSEKVVCILTILRELWSIKSTNINTNDSKQKYSMLNILDKIVERCVALYLKLLTIGHFKLIIHSTIHGLPTLSELGSRLGRRPFIQAIFKSLECKYQEATKVSNLELQSTEVTLALRNLRGPELITAIKVSVDKCMEALDQDADFRTNPSIDPEYLLSTLLPICQLASQGSSLQQPISEMFLNLDAKMYLLAQANASRSTEKAQAVRQTRYPATQLPGCVAGLVGSRSLLLPRTAGLLPVLLADLVREDEHSQAGVTKGLSGMVTAVLQKYVAAETLTADRVLAACAQLMLGWVCTQMSAGEKSGWVLANGPLVQQALQSRLDRRPLGNEHAARADIALRLWREWVRLTESCFLAEGLQPAQDDELDRLQMAPVDWYLDPLINQPLDMTDAGAQVQNAGTKEANGNSSLTLAKDEDEDDFIPLFDFVESGNTSNRLNHLYECLLCLRSQDPNKIQQALESLPSCILTQLGSVDSMAADLASALLQLEQSKLKSRAVIILLLVAPSQFGRWIWQKIFHGDVGLGQKYEVLLLLEKALYESHRSEKSQGMVKELLTKLQDEHSGESPINLIETSSLVSEKKRTLIQEIDEAQSSSLSLRPEKPKIVGENEFRAHEIKSFKDDKIESQSRRWGYANKSFLEKQKDRIASSLLEKTFEERILDQLKPLYFELFGEFFILCK